MNQAIKAQDWYEVGELLKAQIFANEYSTSLKEIQSHYYLIDPEILAVFYLNAPMDDSERQVTSHILENTLMRSPASADIFVAANFHQQVLKNDFQSEAKIDELAQKTNSTIAKFTALSSQTYINMHCGRFDAAFASFRQLLQLHYQSRKPFFSGFIARFIDEVFAASLACPVTDLFAFSFGEEFFGAEAKKLYEMLQSGEALTQHQGFAVQNPASKETLKVTEEQIVYHSRINALQLHLLSIPLHERSCLEYDAVMKLLRVGSDIDLEQIFASLVLNGIVKAKLDSIRRAICITHVKPVSGNNAIKQVLTQRIDDWIARINVCKSQFTDVLDVAEAEAAV